jgi:hypothetical protein
MDKSSSPPYGEIEIRCPRMGGQVTFEYCRIEGGNLPCSRAIACWNVRFEAEVFFREALAPEDFEKAFATPPQPKVVTLVELIEKARKTMIEKQES